MVYLNMTDGSKRVVNVDDQGDFLKQFNAIQKMTPLRRCPECEKKGIVSPILPRRVCEDTAIWKCTSLTCIYPMNMDHEFFKAQFVPVSTVDESLFRRPLPSDYQTCRSISGSGTGSSDASIGGIEKLGSVDYKVVEPTAVSKSTPSRLKRNLHSSPVIKDVDSPLRQNSTSSVQRAVLMKHVVKQPGSPVVKRFAPESEKGYDGSKFAKVSHTDVDVSTSPNAVAFSSNKKLPQQSLLTKSTYGGSSGSFFPGYVPSNKDFSDRKSDASDNSGDRPKRSSAALSSNIKRTLKNSIINSMKPNPSPKQRDSFCNQQTPNHNEISPVPYSNFDLNDPFSSYEMISGQLDKNFQSSSSISNNSSSCLLDPGLISSSFLVDNDDGFFSFSSNSLEPSSQNEGDLGLFSVFNGDYQTL